MKKRIIMMLFAAMINGQWSMVNAQSISRNVISSAGGTMTAGGNMITYNIGEPAIHTLTAGSSQLTQGFEQPGEEIRTGTISPLSFCAGSMVSVPFSAIDIGGGNTFTAQLSNASCSFASPVNIGTLAGNVSGTVSTIIPTLTPAGSGYRIRVVSNSPGKNGSDNGTDIAISAGVPTSSAGALTAPAEACISSVSIVSVNAISGSNVQYSWNTGSNSSVVKFCSIITGPFVNGPFLTTTNSVYAQFGALEIGSSGYNICVQGTNACGSTNNKCSWVRGAVSVPGAITPAAGAVACPNDVKNYVAGTSGGASVYNWTLNGSPAPITVGQGTTNITVTFPGGFAGGSLCVTAALSCGGSSTSAPRCMTITNGPAVAGTMTGPSSICPGATGVTYSVPAVTGAAGYNWTSPAGTIIIGGQNTTSITVSFPVVYTGAPPVCVSANSSCASSVARCKTVGSSIPGQPGAMAGPTTNICNSTVQYSIASVPKANGPTPYTWTNPAGTTITSGQGSTTIQLQVSPSFTSGFLTVTANTNLCSPGSSTPRTITISGKPNTPPTITANPASFCNGGFPNFSVTPISPQPVNNWSVSNGTITAGQFSTNIDVTWGTGTGTVNVIASNTCGSSGTRSQDFTGIACREEGRNSTTAFSVYPNPAHDNLTVSIDVNETAGFTIKLMDVSGRVVLSENRTGLAGLNIYELNLSHLSKGLYMLEVKSSQNNWKKKVVVE
ncbi:MAG: T9SS type A sorting domain-containing protein [Bacteroidia bacterium]